MARAPLSGRPRRRVYRVYGVRLRSAWPLPVEEVPGAEPCDIELEEAPAARFAEAARDASRVAAAQSWSRYLRLSNGSDYLWWSGLFEFLVSPDGRAIVGRPLERASGEAFQTYLLGQVLSFALVKQGIEPLHATVVIVEGTAVGFLGDSGWGKSTLGAAFLQAGLPLLTDDLLVLKDEGGRLAAHPGLPRIKLFPEIARRLVGDETRGTPMNADTAKLVIPLPPGPKTFCSEATPIRGFYVLSDPSPATEGKALTIRRLPPRRAFLALTRNTFNTDVAEPSRLERQFALASRLATTIPVKLLGFPRALDRITEVRNAILEDLGA